jgi:hypothetical protein
VRRNLAAVVILNSQVFGDTSACAAALSPDALRKSAFSLLSPSA